MICFYAHAQNRASFTTPDTVCVKTPVAITNTSVGASSYYWNFCVANLNTTPVGTNLGNIGGILSGPVFMDYAFYNNNYYGFLINHNGGRLIRLDFGNSLLNTPTPVDLGSFGGVIPAVAAEGIQVVQNEGRWYAIIVGGTPSVGYAPRILKVDFGANLANNNPVATNWGNIGNMLHPIDLHVFKEGNNWYGFTLNSDNNTITRFNFTNSFNNTPTAVNLGNVGNLSYPTGIHAINDNGYWRVFIVNGGNDSRTTGTFSLTRLDFGTSLLNTPVGVNLGNPGNMLQHPRDLTIMKMCDQIVGFAVNGHVNNSHTIKINFNNDLSATPSMSSLGNVGNSSFPHSISKLFRANEDVYGFVTNVDNNSVTRLRFSGCTNASIPNSTVKDPSPVTYNNPGTYNINLTVDDGLPTQSAYCKQVVVLPEPQKSPIKNVFICPGQDVKIGSSVSPATYTWSTGATTDSTIVSTPGTYWVESDRFGCSVRDSFVVSYKSTPDVRIWNSDTTIYAGDYMQLRSSSVNGVYAWSPATSLSCSNCSDPIAAPQTTTTYVLNDGSGSCFSQDQVTVTVLPAQQSCFELQVALGGTANERAVDVAKTASGEFYVAGVSKSFGNGDEILITRLKTDGSALWARTYGAGRDESVRKIAVTSDGGLLVIGQTKSFSNPNGEILAFKIDASGAPVWYRKFGLGSTYGDMGMDIIETTDGGYALSGIINVLGGVADQVVIRLNSSADIVWSKRFNRGDGEDGGGILQRGDTLIVATDLQNGSANYHMQVMKLRMSDGGFILSKKLIPSARGIFNPYLYRNPAGPGYFISGHTIDIVSYANMQHVVLKLDDNFNIVKTSLINVSPVTNDFVTGFYPLADGSFVTTASSQVNPDGYTFRVGSDNRVLYSKKINKSSDVRLYRLTVIGQDVVAVGGVVQNGQEDYFITRFPVAGPSSSTCDVQDVAATIGQPAYTATDFTWPSIVDASFANVAATIASNVVLLKAADLCDKPSVDFAFQQDACNTKKVQFTSDLGHTQSFRWEFGNGEVNTSSQTPVVNYAEYGMYTVKLIVNYANNCSDSVVRTVPVEVLMDAGLIANSDTSICAGDSVLLRTATGVLGHCWRASAGAHPTTLASYVQPATTTTYVLTAEEVGTNLVANHDFAQGNTGFSSHYSYAFTNSTEGQYWVGNRPSSWNGGLSPCGDHSTGSGAMMIVNGSPTANVTVWSQTVAVKPNTNYNFSVWIQSLFGVNPAQLQFSINDIRLGNSIGADLVTCQWKRFASVWNSGASTTATITIVNKNTIVMGNDFALDDIFFGEYKLKTDEMTIRVNPKPELELGANRTVCQDSAVQLDSQLGAGASISWSPVLYLDDPGSATPTARPAGSVTYWATATNTNGCSQRDSLTITVLQKPTFVPLSDTSVCRGESVLFHTQSSGATDYSWQPAAGLSDPSTAAPVATPQTATEYIFQASNQGCSVSDTVRVDVMTLPQVTVTEDTTICTGAQVQLNAAGGEAYQWSPAAGLSAANSSNPTASPVTSTTYQVSVKGGNGCSAIDSVRIAVTPKPSFAILPANPSVCLGDAITLKATGGDQYFWSPVSQAVFPDTDFIEVSPSSTTRYKVVIKNLACSMEDSLFAVVQVNPKPVTSVKKSNDIDCSNFEARLTATGGDQYEWFPSEGLSNAAIYNPVASPSRTTTYQVKVVNGQGCSSLDSLVVKVDATGLQRLHVPNAFTPNGDGKNDCFGVRHWGVIKDFSLTIYNRWGEKVYSSHNASDCWDGRYKGVTQPSGVFVYLIKGTTICGEINKKGLVTLVR